MKRANKIQTAFHLIIMSTKTEHSMHVYFSGFVQSRHTLFFFVVVAFHRIFYKFHKMSVLCQVKRFRCRFFICSTEPECKNADFVNLSVTLDTFCRLFDKSTFFNAMKFVFYGLIRLLRSSCNKCNEMAG